MYTLLTDFAKYAFFLQNFEKNCNLVYEGAVCLLIKCVLKISYIWTAWLDNNNSLFKFAAHPWILFYTERTLTALSIKSKAKTIPRLILHRDKHQREEEEHDEDSIDSGNSTKPPFLYTSLSCKSEDADECGFVDALSVAVSNVRISEPKRSRLCSPTGLPIVEQQHSSNLRSNTLCKAFWNRLFPPPLPFKLNSTPTRSVPS